MKTVTHPSNLDVEKLGLTLKRRYAKMTDVPNMLWTPSVVRATPAGGIFDHLKKIPARMKLELPAQTMTWVKFVAQVLMNYQVRSIHWNCGPQNYPLFGLVTGDENLFQWDSPVSWYFEDKGSPVHKWGLQSNMIPVKAISSGPDSRRKMILFHLEGCQPRDHVGGAFFPECLKSEFHGIRSVIEAYAKSYQIEGVGDANGVALTNMPLTFRVETDDSIGLYTIDWMD